ncbi:hypothetical protein QTO34_017811 [Cnephaeus nilssonii]|uniref:non-specific serine/threonine protein kinase n=1 Tax=Cnephaeus nilssonii TaxID=3371016 RepID=A0AA40I2K7_CNENI|nr:hypothetical protein QTO34_017811 [Eptesicus nilssonii]
MTDFGLRNEFTSYKLSTFCDSPSYFIPEFFLASNQRPGVDVWSLEMVLCKFQQLVFTVLDCQQQGSVHRDLKPVNVLCHEAVNIHMTDFGLSNELIR